MPELPSSATRLRSHLKKEDSCDGEYRNDRKRVADRKSPLARRVDGPLQVALQTGEVRFYCVLEAAVPA